MARTSKALLLLAGLSLAAPAFGDGPPPKLGGFVLGARLGFAFPEGKADAGAAEPLRRAVPVAIPFELDLGGRFPFGLALGAYFQLAPGVPDCPAGETCDALYSRIGVQAEFRFRNGSRVMPWVGGGLGWEFFSFREELNGLGATLTATGPELSLQGGVDFRLGRRWAIGPYLTLAFARFDRERLETSLGNATATVPSGDRSTHTWIHLGVRSSVTF